MYKKTDEAFVIYYDINGSKKDEYEVSLMLVRDSDPNFYVIPKQITGNIGVGSFAGKNNSIVWNYKKDIFKELIGNDYRFKLTIQKINQSSFPWLWTGLGAAVAAGTAAILILRGKNAGPGQSEATTIPALGLSRPN